MLGKRSCDSALLVVLFRNTRCLYPSRKESTKRKKVSAKGKQWIDRKAEEQTLFGKLLETKKEKEKRMKLHEDGKTSKTSPSSFNSELMYVTQFSNVKVIKKSNEQKPIDKVDTNLEDRNSSKIQPNTQEFIHMKCNVNSEPLCEKKADIKREKQTEPLLSKVIIQKLLEFPIHQEYKTVNDDWTADSKIISLSPFENTLYSKYPSVTKVLSATMSEEGKAVLERWKIRMIEKMGLRGFEIYQAGACTFVFKSICTYQERKSPFVFLFILL
jgi:hypothetical protein